MIFGVVTAPHMWNVCTNFQGDQGQAPCTLPTSPNPGHDSQYPRHPGHYSQIPAECCLMCPTTPLSRISLVASLPPNSPGHRLVVSWLLAGMPSWERLTDRRPLAGQLRCSGTVRQKIITTKDVCDV